MTTLWHPKSTRGIAESEYLLVKDIAMSEDSLDSRRPKVTAECVYRPRREGDKRSALRRDDRRAHYSQPLANHHRQIPPIAKRGAGRAEVHQGERRKLRAQYVGLERRLTCVLHAEKGDWKIRSWTLSGVKPNPAK